VATRDPDRRQAVSRDLAALTLRGQHRREREQALVWYYVGLALHEGPKAIAAFERAISHGRLYVEIDIVEVYAEANDWQGVIDYAKRLRARGKPGNLVGIWLARYTTAAYAMLGNYKAARTELRNLLRDYNSGPDDTYTECKEVQLDLRRFFRLHPDVKKEMTLAMREFQPY
jgi:hypothetical protein